MRYTQPAAVGALPPSVNKATALCVEAGRPKKSTQQAASPAC
jgi:hypothetical protein